MAYDNCFKERIERVFTSKKIEVEGKNINKVLTGQRCFGKTTLLKQIIELIKKENYDSNIVTSIRNRTSLSN